MSLHSGSLVCSKENESGKRPIYGKHNWFYQQHGNEHLLLFYEYFHGDNGNGLGASHQTGWTSMVAELINEMNKNNPSPEILSQKNSEESEFFDEEMD